MLMQIINLITNVNGCEPSTWCSVAVTAVNVIVFIIMMKGTMAID